MQIPFVGFQPIRTSEHMAAAGKSNESDGLFQSQYQSVQQGSKGVKM